MTFLPKVSKTENDVKEEAAILFLQNLFLHSNIKTRLTVNDKTPDIDGYLDVLDSESRIVGKIAIQSKTVPSTYYGKNKFDCPTSLFGYATHTTDTVFLIAYDPSRDIALWKYISRQLISLNQDKSDQKTILLNFVETEELSQDNRDNVIQQWSDLIKREVELFGNIDHICDENEELRSKIIAYQNPNFTINEKDVAAVQQFSDRLNHLWDNEFKYLKDIFHPNMWKQGVAIFEYTDKSVFFALYSIKYGENSLLIKELPNEDVRKMRGYLYSSCADNVIKNDYAKHALKIIQNSVNQLVKSSRILPSYEEFVVEYVYDFYNENKRTLNLDKNKDTSISGIIRDIELRYHWITKRPDTVIVKGRKKIHINLLYSCLVYMKNRGYTELLNPYPPKQTVSSHCISSVYSSQSAKIKAKYILDVVFFAYADFIQNHFPMLSSELDLFYNADLVLIEMSYPDGGEYWEHSILMYYFKCEDPDGVCYKEFSFDKDSTMYKINNITEKQQMWEKEGVIFQGRRYHAFRSDGIKLHSILWGKYCMINTFYDFLKKRFEDYFKAHLQ